MVIVPPVSPLGSTNAKRVRHGCPAEWLASIPRGILSLRGRARKSGRLPGPVPLWGAIAYRCGGRAGRRGGRYRDAGRARSALRGARCGWRVSACAKSPIVYGCTPRKCGCKAPACAESPIVYGFPAAHRESPRANLCTIVLLAHPTTRHPHLRGPHPYTIALLVHASGGYPHFEPRTPPLHTPYPTATLTARSLIKQKRPGISRAAWHFWRRRPDSNR